MGIPSFDPSASPLLGLVGRERAVEEREVIVVALGLFAAAFLWTHLPTIRRLPAHRLLVAAVSCLLLGWIISVLEDVTPFLGANILEHALYLGHSLLLATWAYRLSVSRGRT